MKKLMTIFVLLVLAQISEAGTCKVRLFREYGRKCLPSSYSRILNQSLSELRTNVYMPAGELGANSPATYQKNWSSPSFQDLSFETNDPKACLRSAGKILQECTTPLYYPSEPQVALIPGERAQAFFVTNEKAIITSDSINPGKDSRGITIPGRQVVLLRTDTPVNGSVWTLFLNFIP